MKKPVLLFALVLALSTIIYAGIALIELKQLEETNEQLSQKVKVAKARSSALEQITLSRAVEVRVMERDIEIMENELKTCRVK